MATHYNKGNIMTLVETVREPQRRSIPLLPAVLQSILACLVGRGQAGAMASSSNSSTSSSPASAPCLSPAPQTRQRLGFKKGDLFEPTPNVRNPHMLEVSCRREGCCAAGGACVMSAEARCLRTCILAAPAGGRGLLPTAQVL